MKNIFTTLFVLSWLFSASAHGANDSDFKKAIDAIDAGDCDTGIPVLKEMADQNIPGALINLGNIYVSGQCGDKNIKKANALYKAAAELNIPIGHYQYGLLHFGDASYDPNYKLVFEEWTKAYNLGLPIQYELSILYYKGLGTDVNVKKAEELLIDAYKNGDREAQKLLKSYYSDSNSLLYNEEKADNI